MESSEDEELSFDSSICDKKIELSFPRSSSSISQALAYSSEFEDSESLPGSRPVKPVLSWGKEFSYEMI